MGIYTLPLSDVAGDVVRAGGKGASLGELIRTGIPVPPGFAILSSTFDHFLHVHNLTPDIDAALHTVNHEDVASIERASTQIRAMIESRDFPEDMAREITASFRGLAAQFVAVRSSATAEDSGAAAWAGQLESYLNTTEETLLAHVRKCFASLFTPRAIAYRFDKGLHGTPVSVAVVVQAMIQSMSSGIAFSVHPVTQDRNQLIIEAGRGLGEAIVSGAVTPDSYVLEKAGRQIIDKHVNDQTRMLVRDAQGGNKWRDVSAAAKGKQVLTDKEIQELAAIVLQIEQHYGFPVDVEWAREGGKFFIIQSRPITTLGSPHTDKLIIQNEEWHLWISRNMSFWHNVTANHGYYHLTHDWGLETPLRILALTQEGTQTHTFRTKENGEAFDADILRIFSSRILIRKLRRSYETFANDLLNTLEVCRRSFTTKNWDAFSESYARFCCGLSITASMGRIGSQRLSQALARLKIPEFQIPGIISTITYPSPHTPLFTSTRDLLIIGREVQEKKLAGAALRKKLDRWMESHAHIPVNFCDEPWTLQDVEKRLSEAMKKNCAEQLQEMEQSHHARIRSAKRMLTKLHNPEISLLAYALQEATSLNEFRKNVFSRVSLDVRPLFQYIASQAKLASWRDCYYLDSGEIRSILTGECSDAREIVKMRSVAAVLATPEGKMEMLTPQETEKILAYIHSPPVQAITPSGTTVKGFSANRGVVQGVARIVLNSKDFPKLHAGEIIVTTMTSVDFVPVMERAAAFVTNEGGITSHASIVAREMNKPCIIGTKNATSVIRDGDLVEVDANAGVVRIIAHNTAEWVKVWVRDYAVQMFAVPLLGLQSVPNILHHPVREAYTVPEHNMQALYAPKEEFRLLEKSIKNVYVDNTKNLRAFIKQFDHASKVLVTISQSLSKNVKNLSNRELLDRYLAFNEKIQGYGAYLWVTFILNEEMMKKTVSVINSMSISPHEKTILTEYAITPSYASSVMLLAQESRRKSLKELAKEFEWFSMLEIHNNPATKNEIAQRLTGVFSPKLKKPPIIERLDAKTKEFLDLSRQVTYLKDVRDDYRRKAIYAILPLVEEISKRCGLSRLSLSYLTIEEIQTALNPGDHQYTLQFKAEKRRKNGFLMHMHNSRIDVEDDPDRILQTKKLLESSVQKKEGNSGTISGIIGNKGVVKGKVTIVQGIRNIQKVRKGDILCTVTTNPDYFHTMKTAAAFITDEGGITSHAAIIARELNKPCIVGTKNATQVLKDGDLVEVDANKGEVRILEKDSALTLDLTRPFSLFGDSLWQKWFDSPAAERIYNSKMTHALFLEQQPGISRCYHQKDHIEAFEEHMKSLANDQKECTRLLHEAELLNTQATKKIAQGPRAFPSLEEAVDFLTRLAIYSTRTSYYLGLFLPKNQHRLRAACERLRSVSYYPEVFTKCILPLARKRLAELGITAKDAEQVVLYSELISGQVQAGLILDRLKNMQSGKRFIYEVTGSEERVAWVIPDDVEKRIALLDGMITQTELHGQSSFPGRVQGRARIVVKGTSAFRKGDILIAIHSSPTLLPLIKKCSAMVTDEGGAMCHAAILSRELRKPCVIGTKIATRVLKSGDVIEVDANQGTIKILKRK